MADPKRVRAGKRARSKGKAFELACCAALRKKGYGMRRAQQYRGTETSADLVHDGSDKPAFPMLVECKNYARPPSDEQIAKWLVRAIKDAGHENVCVLLRYGPKRDIWVAWIQFAYDWLCPGPGTPIRLYGMPNSFMFVMLPLSRY